MTTLPKAVNTLPPYQLHKTGEITMGQEEVAILSKEAIITGMDLFGAFYLPYIN
ncbi:MAG TPA: hypothetical protein VEY51_04125 [Chondromyces sp.]|nr:hypothetical protein [Chondromyces sp.]